MFCFVFLVLRKNEREKFVIFIFWITPEVVDRADLTWPDWTDWADYLISLVTLSFPDPPRPFFIIG